MSVRGRGGGRGGRTSLSGSTNFDDDDREDQGAPLEDATIATKKPPPTYPPIWSENEHPFKPINEKPLATKDAFIARQSITLQRLFRTSPYFLETDTIAPEIETWSTQFKQKVNKPKPSEVIQLTPALFPLELLPASMRPKRAPRKKRVEKEAQLFAELGQVENIDQKTNEQENSQEQSEEEGEEKNLEEIEGSLDEESESDERWKRNSGVVVCVNPKLIHSDDSEGEETDDDKEDAF